MLYTILKIFAPYIINTEIEAITSNSYLRLVNNDINPIILDKFMLKIIDKIQQISTPFLLFLFKIAIWFRNCHTIWSKTSTNLECNTGISFKSYINNDSEVDLEKKIDVMPFKDNILYIIGVSRPEEDIAI